MSEEKKDEKDPKNLSDIFKKVMNTGINAAFMTEDTVKNIIQDLPIPKEIVNGLLQNARNSKDEFIKSVKTELRERLNKIDVSKEVDRIIENYDFEINAKIKLTPKEKKPKKNSTKK
ncbi:MAG: hypothetical protein QF441_10770 [Bacteriovoracaceae bacterium]|nr:hypothetical protein [Halobacteriovoraceae bacterium]MDP7321083.1 hypothetical protein [Bacteriovoracaceae bacterium]